MTTPRDTVITDLDVALTDAAAQAAAAQQSTDKAAVDELNAQVADLTRKMAATQERLGDPLAPVDWSGQPLVSFKSLYQSGDTFLSALRRLTKPTWVDVDGLDEEVSDFSLGTLAFAAPNAQRLWSPSPSHARLMLKPTSSTKASLVPAQSAGGNNRLTFMQITTAGSVLHGITLQGSDQPPAWGHPHNYSGLTLYRAANPWLEYVDIVGLGRADNNAPPGETNSLNFLETRNAVMRHVRIDGRDPVTGQRVSGNIGGYGFDTLLIEDCIFNDALYSGMAFGSSGNPKPTQLFGRSLTARRVRVASNANHFGTKSHSMFAGMNFEGMADSLHIIDCDVWIDDQVHVQRGHVRIGNSIQDMPDFRIINLEHHGLEGGSPPACNGCPVLEIPTNYAGATNKQTSLPYWEHYGVVLQPVEWANRSLAVYGQNYIVHR